MKYFGLIIICCLASHKVLYAQINVVQSRIDSLEIVKNDSLKGEINNRLFQDLFYSNLDSTVEVSRRFVSFSKQTGDSSHLFNSRYNLASAYMMKGFTDSSLYYFQDATKYFHSEITSLDKGRFFGNIGILYYRNDQLEAAKSYYEEAGSYFNESSDLRRTSMITSAIGSIYYQQDSLYHALDYYRKALVMKESISDSVLMTTDMFNIGLVFKNLGNIDSALVYLNKAKEWNEEIGEELKSDGIYRSLADIYTIQGKYSDAIYSAQKALELVRKFGNRYDIRDSYETLANTYKTAGETEKAFDYYVEFKVLNDSLINNENTRLLAEAREKYETEKKEKEIALLNQVNANQRLRNIITAGSMGGALVLVFIFGMTYINRRKKEMEISEKERSIADSEKRLAEMELQNEKLKIDQVKNELTNYALHLVEKNEFLDHVKDKLSMIKATSSNSKLKKDITSLELEIHQNVNIQSDMNEFQRKVEQISEGFYYTLKEKYSFLTVKEQRLSALLRLNLSSKEIASILNISVKSVEQSRYRLRKRLGLAKEENLTEFLNNF